MTTKPEPAKALVNPKATTVRNLIEKFMPQIKLALGRSFDHGHFVRVVMTSIQRNPKLLDCEPITLIGAIIQGAQLKLEFDTILGHAHLVPFWNGKKSRLEVQFIAGYKGLVALVRRSKELAGIEARVVHEKDQFRYAFGLNAVLEHRPSSEADPGPVTTFYAIARMVEGTQQFDVMLKHEVDKVMARSPSKNKDKQVVGPWVSDYEEMGKKTVVRRLCKLLPLTIEADYAVSLDERAELGIPQDLGILADPTTETPTEASGGAGSTVAMPKKLEAPNAAIPGESDGIPRDASGKEIPF